MIGDQFDIAVGLGTVTEPGLLLFSDSRGSKGFGCEFRRIAGELRQLTQAWDGTGRIGAQEVKAPSGQHTPMPAVETVGPLHVARRGGERREGNGLRS